jgi:NAD(P)H-flavin reductase
MLFIGTGSGLAPLYSIIQDALNQGHQGDIHLYHGSTLVDGLYLVQELRAMTTEFSNFHYHPCVSSAFESPSIKTGRAHDVALQEISDLRSWRVYLCGHPEMVKQTIRSAYLNGASLKDIYADPFYVSQPNS